MLTLDSSGEVLMRVVSRCDCLNACWGDESVACSAGNVEGVSTTTADGQDGREYSGVPSSLELSVSEHCDIEDDG